MVGSNAPESIVPSLPCSACFLPPGRCWPGHAAPGRFWEKPGPTPTLRFESSGRAGLQLARAIGRKNLKSRHRLGPAGTTPPRWPSFKEQRSVASKGGRWTSKRLRFRCAPASKQGKAARRVDADTRSEKPCPRPTAWDFPCPKEAAAGVKGPPRPGKRKNPHATGPSDSLRGPLKSGVVEGATPGSTLPSRQLQAGAAPVEMWLFFRPHPPSRTAHGSHPTRR